MINAIMVENNIINGIRCHMNENLPINTLPQTLITLPHFDPATAKQWLIENGYICSNNPSKQVDDIIFEQCSSALMKAVKRFQGCYHSCCNSQYVLMNYQFLNYFLDS